MANVVSLLSASDRTALIAPDGESLTFAALGERVGRCAGGLVDMGLSPGDRVVLLVPMGIDLYVSLLALFRVGATAMLVDPSGPVREILSRYPPVAFIGSARAHLLRLKSPALRGLGLYVSTGFTPLPHHSLDGLSGAVPPIDSGGSPALLTFTTGTTGKPKAIARGHDFLIAQHHVLSGHMPVGPATIDLPTLPVFLLHSLAGGATCVIPDADLRAVGTVNPDPVIAQLNTHRVTTTSGSPAFFQRLADRLIETKTTLKHLTAIYTGGARVPGSLIDALAAVAPQASLHIVYGSTEAEPIAVLDAGQERDRLRAADIEGRGALVGRPVEAIDIRIDGPEGQPGEILVAGAHVNPRYLDDPAANARYKVIDGERTWHRTGDAGFLDESGDLWLVGRAGESVAGHWPLQVEGAADRLLFVQRSGLVDLDGEAVIAVALHDPPPDWADQVQRATGLRPVAVDRVPVDPRHNAKVDRRMLRALLTQR
jgi:acyl-CoA synthetase (AMP-forming)/AMP-acid ligase II